METNYSGKSRDVNEITRAYIDSILIEQRLVDSVLPDAKVSIFGETFDTPIMTPAFSHLKAFAEGRETGMVEYARAAEKCNIVNWAGMETDASMEQILATGARTIRIIKPFEDHQKILDQMAFAQEHGAFALGIDIDHVYGYDGKYDVVEGEKMGPVSMEDIRHYVSATPLPFIIKGVLSVTDALKCAECGVRGIVVSHHHGRMPYALPPLKVLPQIAEALKDSNVTIFADCHIDSGVDAFKALALGADAVSVGRAMLDGLRKDGTDGVVKKLTQMKEELITVMGYTGSRTPDQISRDLLWIK